MGLPSRKRVRLPIPFLVLPLVLASYPAAQAPPPPAGISAAARRALQRDIQEILDREALDRAEWGILVRSLRTGQTIYAFNPGKLLMPGSTLKILTLAAAAERLGWDYTYRTEVFAAGPIDAGVLKGDLIVVGSGDPSIMDGSHLLEMWADTLLSAGIRAIDGRIIGDDSAFDHVPFGPGWTWEDLAGRDGAPVGALEFNENVAAAIITPGAERGRPAAVAITPEYAGLTIDNDVVTTGAGTAPSVEITRLPGTTRISLRGSVPFGAQPATRVVSVANPTVYFASAFRAALVSRGISVGGAAIDIHDLADPPARTGMPLVAYDSPPLATLATRLMKMSQNLYAESLLKTLGGTEGTPSWAMSVGVEREVLTEWGIPEDDVVQVDGSGLSRYNYVTAGTLVAVLTHIHQDETLRAPFEASLPIAGRDGTLAARLAGTAAENNVRAKTGSLANARSMAGFVTSADGEPLVFAILSNNYGANPEMAVSAIDAIAARIAEFKLR